MRATGAYTLTTSSQGVHGLQGALTGILKVDASKIRVITPDVGGGFGTKSFIYREYPLLLEAAKRIGKPVRWVSDRSEHFFGDAHGRDNLTHAEMALDATGKFLALRVDIRGNLGAYLSQFGPYIPWLAATMATGPYDIPAVHARVRGIYTHTVPVDAYRGAGRPEAAYLLERLVDQCARALNMPREEIRARNFVKPEQMPYKTVTDRTYDVGEFEAAMRKALQSSGYHDFAGRDAMARASGKDPRHRLCELYRMHRLGRGRERLGQPRSRRHVHRARRHAIERAGPRDGLRADGGAASRCRARARQDGAGRHRARRDRQRHRRLALDPDRRGRWCRAPPRSSSSS